MTKSTLIYAALFLPALLAGCSSAKQAVSKTNAVAKQTTAVETMCNRAIKYYIEKSITINNGVEKERQRSGHFIISPGNRLFVTKGDDSQIEEAEMRTESCSLAAGMQSGEAVYSIKDKDSMITIRVVAVNGDVTITMEMPRRGGGMKASVVKWETVD